MKIMAVDNDLTALNTMSKSIKAVFNQGEIEVLEYQDPMFAMQYIGNNPHSVVLLFAALQMRRIDGFRLAEAVRKLSPQTTVFFTIQEECQELRWLAKQHGGITCLPKPITDDKLKDATIYLFEECLMEDEFCGKGCLWEWCEHRKRKTSV